MKHKKTKHVAALLFLALLCQRIFAAYVLDESFIVSDPPPQTTPTTPDNPPPPKNPPSGNNSDDEDDDNTNKNGNSGSNTNDEIEAQKQAELEAQREAERKRELTESLITESDELVEESESSVEDIPVPNTPSYKEQVLQAQQDLERGKALLQNAKNTADIEIGRGTIAQSEARLKQLTEAAGDPVMLATGEYTESDCDFTISAYTLQFPLLRSYRSNNRITGSLGYGWISTLDQRLILGEVPGAEEILKEQQTLVTTLERTVSRLEQQFKASYGCSSPSTAKSELETKKQKLSAARNEILQAQNTLQKALTTANSQQRSRIQQKLSSISTIQASMSARISQYDAAISQVTSDTATLNNYYGQLNAARQELSNLETTQKSRQAKLNPNLSTRFPGTPDYWFATGDHTLIIVNEDGSTIQFTEAAVNVWYPVADTVTAKAYTVLAQAADGSWNLQLRNGTVKVYDTAGYLVRITDRKGNWLAFTRESDSHRVTAIKTITGESFTLSWNNQGFLSECTSSRDRTNTIIWNYSGILLTRFTDQDHYSTGYEYDGRKVLSALIKSDGSRITQKHGYTSEGNCIVYGTTNEAGYSESFDYDFSTGKVTYTDHDGAISLFQLDTAGRIISSTNGPEGTIQNSWSENGLLMSKKANGNTTSYSYNSSGDLTKTSYSDRSMELWYQNSYGETVRYTDRDNHVTEYIRDPKGNIIQKKTDGKISATYTYDAKSQLMEKTEYHPDPVKTFYTWDTWGNLTSSTTNGITTSYTYDERNRITSRSIGTTCTDRWTYTPRSTIRIEETGLKTEYLFDDRKDITSVIYTDTITGESRIYRYTYDERHLPVKETLNDIPLSECRYSAAGNPVLRIEYDATASNITFWTWKNGQEETRTHFSLTGQQNTALWQGTSTPEQIPWAQEVQRAAQKGDFIRYTYGKVFHADGSYTRTVEDTKGHKAAVVYDPWNRIISVTDNQGRSSTQTWTPGGELLVPATETDTTPQNMWTQYDDHGRITRVCIGKSDSPAASDYYEEFTYTQGGRVITRIQGGLVTTTFTLNAFGEITAVTDGNGNTTVYTYTAAGHKNSVTDPAGFCTRYEYDNFGNLTDIINADGVRYSDIPVPQEYPEQNSQPDYASIPGGDGNGITVDTAGHITAVKNSSCTLLFTWNKAGLLTSQKETRTGETISWTYDTAGQKTGERYTRNGAAISDFRFDYDCRGNVVSVKDLIQHTSITASYDSLNREISRTAENGTVCHTRYDREGRVCATWITDRSGRIMQAECSYFDKETGWKSAAITLSGVLTVYDYNADGRLQSVWYSVNSGMAESMKSLALKNGSNDERTSVKGQMRSISRDAAASLKELMNEIQPSLGNLVPATCLMTGETYEYDNKGNRIRCSNEFGTIVYRYDDSNHLVSSGMSFCPDFISYSWDTSGNLMSVASIKEKQLYSYDTRNRMIESQSFVFTDKGGEIAGISKRYTYDALGRRYTCESGAEGNVRYVYDGISFNCIIETSETPDEPQYRYRWLGETAIEGFCTSRIFLGNAPVAESRGNSRLYYGNNSTGSITAITDQYGNLKKQISYSAFGLPVE